MTYRIRASDRAAFKRCRRAWDLGSRNRRNFEPIRQDDPIDLQSAVRDALAVYYFPGMWEWNRTIVQPLVHQALERAIRSQPQAADADEETLRGAVEWGRTALDAYAAWAPTVDYFTPVRIDTDFEITVPDPTGTGLGLLTADHEEIRYTDRIDLLAVDYDDTYWMVQHRLVDDWSDDDDLQLDERTIAWCWAWPLFYLGMEIAGTVYNEIRVDSRGLEAAGPALPTHHPVRHRRMYARADAVPRERVRSEGTDAFRRTRIPRSAAEVAAAGADIAREARIATRDDLDVYPSPEPEVCARCAYTAPCLTLNEGGDPGPELERDYRRRDPEPVEEGRLGGATWSMNRGAAPPRFPGGS